MCADSMKVVGVGVGVRSGSLLTLSPQPLRSLHAASCWAVFPASPIPTSHYSASCLYPRDSTCWHRTPLSTPLTPITFEALAGGPVSSTSSSSPGPLPGLPNAQSVPHYRILVGSELLLSHGLILCTHRPHPQQSTSTMMARTVSLFAPIPRKAWHM